MKRILMLLFLAIPLARAQSDFGGLLLSAIDAGSGQRVAEILAEGVLTQEDLDTGLAHACRTGNLSLAKSLLGAGANANALSQDTEAQGTERLETSINEAVASENLDLVKLLVDRGARIRTTKESFYAPLTVAARDGDDDMITYLRQKGASLEEKNRFGEAPLDFAIESRHFSLARKLVSEMVNVDYATELDETPLLKAARYGSVELTVQLLKRGANPNYVQKSTSTPILYELFKNACDLADRKTILAKDVVFAITRALIDAGANPNARAFGPAPYGEPQIISSIRCGFDDSSKYLIAKGLHVNQPYRDSSPDKTLLQVAIDWNNKAVALDLLDHGAKDISGRAFISALSNGLPDIASRISKIQFDPNATDPYGATCLMWALYKGDVQLARAVIQRGGRVAKKGILYLSENHSSFYGSPLAVAAGEGNLEQLRMLLATGSAGINDREATPPEMDGRVGAGWTPLEWAVQKHNLDAVNLLLQRGANPNVTNSDGVPILFIASSFEDLRTAQMLLVHGANPAAKTKDNGNILIYAAAGNLQLFKKLAVSVGDLNLMTTSGVAPIGIAAGVGNAPIVFWLKEEGVSISSASQANLLFLAASGGNLEILNAVLAEARDVNRSDDSGMTALMIAAAKGRCSAVDMLLQHGAQPELLNLQGEDAVTLASGTNSECVRSLLAAGGLANGAKKKSDGALLRAIARKDNNSVKMLLAAGADASVTNEGDETPLELALNSDDDEIVATLASFTPVPARLIERLIDNQDAKDVKTLISHARRFEPDELGMITPLFVAVDQNMPDLISQLSTERSYLNRWSMARDASTLTPLQLAIALHRLEAVSILLPMSDLAARNEEGDTALHIAARIGDIDICNRLIAAGAGVNEANNAGETPLHAAVEGGNSSIVRTLLAARSSPSVMDNQGRSPIDIAAERAELTSLEILTETQIDLTSVTETGQSPLHIASRSACSACVELLLEDGFDANTRDAMRRTSLHYAAASGLQETSRILCERGAVIGSKDNDGNTPLHLAASAGHSGLALMLVTRGAKLSDTNNDGKTPLELAILHGQTDVLQSARAQLSKEAFVQLAGSVPVLVAAKHKHWATVEALIDAGLSPNEQEDSGGDISTPLSLGIRGHQGRAVVKLLAGGADIKTGTIDGRTLISFLATSDKSLLMSVLANAPALNIKTFPIEQRQQLWQRALDEDDAGLAAALIERGDTASFVLSSGYSVRDAALDQHRSRMTALLGKRGGPGKGVE